MLEWENDKYSKYVVDDVVIEGKVLVEWGEIEDEDGNVGFGKMVY